MKNEKLLLKDVDRKSKFLSLVEQELKHIKKHATKEEINKLNLSIFDPDDFQFCIYGQMTGSCFSERARTLFPKTLLNIGDSKSTYNKWLKEERLERRDSLDSTTTFTPLEVYITFKDAKIKSIFNFLQGKTKNIKL